MPAKSAQNKETQNNENINNLPAYRRIENIAFEILKKNKDGVRFMELVRAIKNKDSSLNENTIQGTIYNLHDKFPEKVYKPARGIFRLVEFRQEEESDEISLACDEKEISEKKKRSYHKNEERLYDHFVAWLQNELEEVTKAISLGGNKFGPKWLTPDVIGIRKARESDVIKFQTEVVSAEIKYDESQTITGLGQASAYKLFSHRVYLVIPKNVKETELSIMDSLCQINGIGLVLFNEKGNEVFFEIKCRPIKNDPDPFYMNEYIKKIESELFG